MTDDPIFIVRHPSNFRFSVRSSETEAIVVCIKVLAICGGDRKWLVCSNAESTMRSFAKHSIYLQFSHCPSPDRRERKKEETVSNALWMCQTLCDVAVLMSTKRASPLNNDASRSKTNSVSIATCRVRENGNAGFAVPFISAEQALRRCTAAAESIR